MRPKCKEVYFTTTESCAIGAAYQALTGETEEVSSFDISDYIAERFGIEHKLLVEIFIMNDGSNCFPEMTREEIAHELAERGL
jgi:hypothetical protein